MEIGLQTPLGPVCLTETDGVIRGLHWRAAPPGGDDAGGDDAGGDSAGLREAAAQVRAYFDGRLTRFDLTLDWGTGLQAQLRRAMAAIPFGQTRTYGDLARQIGVPAQAIGQACGANPLPILIPCHRVLGASSLGGFSARGGVETKVWLLRHEGAAGLLI